MAFFEDWQLWAKMVFVLAVAIVVTVSAGLIKLGLDHRKLKKYTQMEKDKEQAQPMVEDPVAKERRGRVDAPFGIRAIESGVEVEGVWISKGNSPASSAPVSPKLGAQNKGKTPSRASEIPDIAIPPQTHSNRSQSPTGSSTDSFERAFERATSAERVESVPSTPGLTSGPRRAYKPHQPSSLRFSTADQTESGNTHVRNTSGFYRSASGSSASSSDGSPASPPNGANHTYEKRTSYYRPTSYANMPSRQSVTTEYVRSPGYDRVSYAHDSRESIASAPRLHYPTNSQSSISAPFQQGPYGRSLPDLQQSVPQEGLLDTVELKDNPITVDLPPEKVRRTTRKLQKKAPLI